jgi:protoporphyrinogen oxidase
MGAFMRAMGEWIARHEHGSLHLQRAVTPDEVKAWREVSDVLLCVPPSVAASLLPSEPVLAERLRSLEGLGLVSATLFFDASERLKEGFGVLIPSSENLKTLGVLFNDAIFMGRAREGLCSETWILRTSSLSSTPDEELLNFVLREERVALGGSEGAKPVARSVRRWERALPLYGIALERFLKDRPFEGLHGLHLFGNYLGALGLSRILQEASEWPRRIKP